MERAADCKKVREVFARLIYLYLAGTNFFRHFTKQISPTCWETLFLMYSVGYLCGCNMKRVFVENVSSQQNFSYTGGKIKVKKTFFRLILSPQKTIHQHSVVDVKMVLLAEKIGKAYKVRNIFCLHDRRNSKLGIQTWSLLHSQSLRMGFYYVSSLWTAFRRWPWLHRIFQ